MCAHVAVTSLTCLVAACCKEQIWCCDNYISLHSPLSPCVSLQWTMRDDQLVNLPTSLLVRDDVIYLRPGQTVPASCQSLQQVCSCEWRYAVE